MYERMLDKLEQPTPEELTAHCEEGAERFQELHMFLSAHYQTKQELRFPYGKQYGWGITHRKGKKLICDVFAEAGAFTVMLRLSDAQFHTVYPQLQAAAQQLIDQKYPCGDGGWIHYRVLSEEDLKDVELLLSVKCG